MRTGRGTIDIRRGAKYTMIKLSAFCDASYDLNTRQATACTVILSEMIFHAMFTNTYTDVETSTRAELLGLIQTVRRVREIPDVEHTTIYCDSATNAKAFNSVIGSGVVQRDSKYYEDWCELLSLCDGLNIEATHIYGHQMKHNPNKLCDVICHSLLKAIK